MGFMVVHYLPLRLIWFLQEIDELHGELTRTTPYVSFTYLNETNVHQMPGNSSVYPVFALMMVYLTRANDRDANDSVPMREETGL